MQWDPGVNGLLYLAAMSLAFGVLAALLAGQGAAYGPRAGGGDRLIGCPRREVGPPVVHR